MFQPPICASNSRSKIFNARVCVPVNHRTPYAKALSGFLAQTFGQPWLDKADIQKSKDILVVSGVLIRLSDDRKKATCKLQRQETS